MSDKIDVIRKLLAKAEGAATPEEAEAYTAKALDLMARHGVEEAMIADADPGPAQPVVQRTYRIHAPYSKAKAAILSAVAAANSSFVLHGGDTAYVFGRAADLDRIEMVFASLLLQAIRGVSRALPPLNLSGQGGGIKAFRRAWLLGFAARVSQRLTEAKETATTATPGSALVLASRGGEAEAAAWQAFPQARKARTPTVDGAGYRAGAEAGSRADLGARGVGAGGRRALA